RVDLLGLPATDVRCLIDTERVASQVPQYRGLPVWPSAVATTALSVIATPSRTMRAPRLTIEPPILSYLMRTMRAAQRALSGAEDDERLTTHNWTWAREPFLNLGWLRHPAATHPNPCR